MKEQFPVEYITPEYEAFLDARYKETLEAIKNGTAYTITSAEELTELAMNYVDEECA